MDIPPNLHGLHDVPVRNVRRGTLPPADWVTVRTNPQTESLGKGATVVSPVSAMTAGLSRYRALRRPISSSSSFDGLVWTDISAYPNCLGEVILDRTGYVAVGNVQYVQELKRPSQTPEAGSPYLQAVQEPLVYRESKSLIDVTI